MNSVQNSPNRRADILSALSRTPPGDAPQADRHPEDGVAFKGVGSREAGWEKRKEDGRRRTVAAAEEERQQQSMA